jgi:two-component system phosphate regulon sensor histidine kinase PhoR
MRGGSAGSLTGEQLKVVNRINVRLNELLGIIDRWLKFSRIDDVGLKKEFRKLDLQEVINESVDSVGHIADAHNVSLMFESNAVDSVVCGDRQMLKEVFTNLITNGVKYNREAGSVTISLYENDSFLVVDVSDTDTGIGISEGDIPHLGGEFYRVKRQGITPGVGIGLAIVKKILDMHGGRLEIESELDEGSKFSVFLPKQRSDTNE